MASFDAFLLQFSSCLFDFLNQMLFSKLCLGKFYHAISSTKSLNYLEERMHWYGPN